MNSLVIFAKYPTPGSVKTRLGNVIGYSLAAELYRIFLNLTFEIGKESAAKKVSVTYEPPEKADAFMKIIPPQFERFSQCDGNLGQKLFHASETAFRDNACKLIMLGSDSPTLPVKFIDEAFKRLGHFDLVLGPAEDGGYYLIGMKQTHNALFENIEWSKNSVLQSTVERAKALGLNYYLLPKWYDVDDLGTLLRAAEDDHSGKIKSYLRNHSQIAV